MSKVIALQDALSNEHHHTNTLDDDHKERLLFTLSMLIKVQKGLQPILSERIRPHIQVCSIQNHTLILSAPNGHYATRLREFEPSIIQATNQILASEALYIDHVKITITPKETHNTNNRFGRPVYDTSIYEPNLHLVNCIKQLIQNSPHQTTKIQLSKLLQQHLEG